MSPIPDSTRPRVVIVGAGFGGLAAARALARTPAEVTVIDRRNYHLFQPLLYQVATAALSPADIAWPIRVDPRPAEERGRADGQGGRGRSRPPRGDPGGSPRRLRLSGARDRRPALLFRHGRVGDDRTGPEEDRRRHAYPRARAAGLRAGRGHRRPGRAPAPAHLRGRRRRPHRRRDGRCRGRARQPRPGPRTFARSTPWTPG